MGQVKENVMGKSMYIIIPGYNGSGADHWQSHWEQKLSDVARVVQRDWLNPTCSEWVAKLDEVINKTKGSKILIAHSLGCSTVIQWAKNHGGDVIGALLVSPPDLESFTEPALIKIAETFMPPNLNSLPFKSIVVASSNDPYSKIDRMKYLANCWGSKFISIGNAGHINVDSGYGPWPEGLKYLRELRG